MLEQDQSNDKIFKHNLFMQAIDFFTQKLNMQQLAKYAFHFFNEMLSLEASAMFLKNKNEFILVQNRNYRVKKYSIQNTEYIQKIATLHGHVLDDNFQAYFHAKDIEMFNAKIIIPLIIHDLVVGFIISCGKKTGTLSKNEYMTADTLMRLVNHSLENIQNYHDLRETNIQLDQKVFNLSTINHCSKTLLSELEIDKLYTLAADVFSEVTCSKVTSFGIYDEILKKVIIRGYKNVYTFDKYYGEFELRNKYYYSNQIVLHYQKDIQKIKEIFVNWSDFAKLDTEYIILLVQEQILGFVTISKSINDREYDEALFELVDSLATSAYIALSNAMLINKIKQQKLMIENKYHILTKLNTLIKNIKNCIDLDELCNVTIKTLHVVFGIDKALISLRINEKYEIKEAIGFKPRHKVIDLSEHWKNIDYEGILCQFHSKENRTYFSEDFLFDVGQSNCLVISPISVESYEFEEDTSPLGYIVVFALSKNMIEDLPLLIDTISGNISPIIKSMLHVEKIKKEYIVNQRESFVNALNKMLFNKKYYFIPFYVYYKKILPTPFEDPDLSAYQEYEYFYFDNILLVLSETALDKNIFDGCVEPNSLDELKEKMSNMFSS